MHGAGLELALVLLLAAVLAVPMFKRFGLGAVLGYLAARAILGAHALGVIDDAAPVLAASEIGVVMLLFVIGLELSLPRLKVMRRPIVGIGGLQVLRAIRAGRACFCFLRYSRKKRASETAAGPLLGGASSAATST